MPPGRRGPLRNRSRSSRSSTSSADCTRETSSRSVRSRERSCDAPVPTLADRPSPTLKQAIRAVWQRPLTEPCPNCGGLLLAQAGGKAKCNACGAIVEDGTVVPDEPEDSSNANGGGSARRVSRARGRAPS